MGRIVIGNLKSKLLKRDIPYRVILPAEYDSNIADFPVLYLLHGLFGSCDNWLDLTEIRKYSLPLRLIIVLVEGENAWYSDNENVETEKFYSYIIEELLPEISLKYRVGESKQAIAGLSMGGYGAFKFGLKRPDLFTFVGSMSGAFVAPNRCEEENEDRFSELLPSIGKVFGKRESHARSDNDLFQIITALSPKEIENLPFFYFDCGLEDSFLPVNQQIAGVFEERRIPFDFQQIEGGHDWDYWNKQLREILSRAEKFLVTG